VKPEDRDAFRSTLANFFEAVGKPLTESALATYWRALADMSILTFSRCRDAFLEELRKSENPPKYVTVALIWRLARTLRAAAPSVGALDTWKGDGWDLVANHRLLAYVRTQGAQGVYYCAPPDRDLMAPWRGPDWQPTELTRALTAALLAFAKAWAQDMREEDNPTLQRQHATWKACMRRAEEQCAQLREAA
jgi:hypothetical protein